MLSMCVWANKSPNVECAVCTIKKYGDQKKSNPQENPASPRLNPQVKRGGLCGLNLFLRVENIDLPR